MLPGGLFLWVIRSFGSGQMPAGAQKRFALYGLSDHGLLSGHRGGTIYFGCTSFISFTRWPAPAYLSIMNST